MKSFTLTLLAVLCFVPMLSSAQSKCSQLYNKGYDSYELAYDKYEKGMNLYVDSKQRTQDLAIKLAYDEDVTEDIKVICNNFARATSFFDDAEYYLSKEALPKLNEAKKYCGSGENAKTIQNLINVCEDLKDELQNKKLGIKEYYKSYGICE